MRRQTFDRIKKTVSVLLAVFFVISLTASAGAACKDNTATTPTTSDTDSKTLSPSDLGSLLASLLNNMNYKMDPSNSGSSLSFPSNSESSLSFPSNSESSLSFPSSC